MTSIVSSSKLKIKNEADLPEHISLDQYHQLLSLVSTHRQNNPRLRVRDTLLFELLMQCGGRISDILDIKMSDIETRTIFLERPEVAHYLNLRVKKTRIINGIPLSPTLMNLIYEHVRLSNVGDGPLFNITRTQAWRIVQAYGNMAGIRINHFDKKTKQWVQKPLHPHHLRHSSAVNMMRQGMPLPVISAILGHASIDITYRMYLHVSSEVKKEWMDKIIW